MAELTYQGLLERLDGYIGEIDGSSARSRRRLHILRIATELFARQGYRKTSMDEVAQRAGVAKGTVYTYFATKVDLAVAAIALEKREHIGVMMEVFDPSRTAEQRLRSWILTLLLMPARMPLTAALVRGDQEMAAIIAELPAELMQQGVRDRNDFLRPLIDEVAHPHAWTTSELDDRVSVLSGMGFISTFLQDEHVRNGVPMERYAEILTDILVAGLRGGGTKGSES